MLQLDVRSIVVTNSIYAVSIAIFMLFADRRSSRRIPGLNWWALGFLLLSLDFLLIAAGDFLPSTVSNILPHVLGICGLLFVKMGLARFYQVARSLWSDGFILILSTGALFVVTGDTMTWRVLVVAVSNALVFITTLWMLRSELKFGALSVLYSTALVLQALAIWQGMTLSPYVHYMDAGNPQAIISVVQFLSVLFPGLALLAMTVERLLGEKDLLADRAIKNSITDELTGLMNRHGFSSVYAMEEKRSVRRKRHLSFIVADIDGFKGINDRFGQACGDEVLKHVADVFRREFRGEDLLARWGGEEFLIVQPETDAESCRVSLERARQAVARDPFKHDGETFFVTMSFGYHTALAGDLPFEKQLRKADDSMYSAKEGGKNRIVGGVS